MELSELSRWLLLGFVSEDEVLRDWNYHDNANYQILQQNIEGARKFGKGDPKREVEFLELRLPLVLYSKERAAEGCYCIEFYRMEGDILISTIRTHTLNYSPSHEYAEKLMKHLQAQQYKVKNIEEPGN